MIRVLLVTHSLAGGGAERFAATLAGALAESSASHRFEPELAVVSDLADAYPLAASVPVHRLGYRGRLGLARTALRLRRLIGRRQPDVVLSNVLSTNALTGAALLAMRSPPSWVARVGLAPDRGDPLLRRWFARVAYPRADVLVGNSRQMAEALRARYPSVRRVVHLPSPVDFDRLDQLAAVPLAPEPLEPEPRGAADPTDGEGPTLLAVGRLTRQKRPDLALEALARVRRRLPARLVWLGDGPLRAETLERAAALGLADAVSLPGFAANPFAWMRRADLFLLTSDFEGLPNALIEAQGLGLPAVATGCRYGPEEIVEDGESGRIVPPGDAEAVAAAVVELLADPDRRASMAAAARQRARALYGLAPAVTGWAQLLAEVAGGDCSPLPGARILDR